MPVRFPVAGALLSCSARCRSYSRPPIRHTAVLGVALFVRGFGGGSITIPSAAAAYSSVPRESLGHATTSINICQRFGGPTGSAGLAIFLQFALLRAGTPVQAYHWAFLRVGSDPGGGVGHGVAVARPGGAIEPERRASTNTGISGHMLRDQSALRSARP